MEHLVNTWGLYSFYPNLKEDYKYIHPNDLESLKALFPYRLVFFCVSEDSDYICLTYGKFKAKVKPDLYRKVEADGYFIEDIVEILNGSS